MDIQDKLKKIPQMPGVYFFHNKKGEIIYIGKAKVLKNRVRSYFNSSNTKDAKTQVLIKHIADIEWLVVGSEVEALLTEANLIKEHKPKYNVFLKDDKTFPYIRITQEPYPRVEIIRQKNLTKDSHNYFGPYTDAGYLREILRVIHKIFPIRTCTFNINKKSIIEKKFKVCLDYHIKRCDGPCEGLVKEKEYQLMIKQISQFLKGRNLEIQKYLKTKMEYASSKLEYEEAGRYRDQWFVVKEFMKKQKKVSQDFKDRDIVALTSENTYGMGIIMRVRNGHMMGQEKFVLKINDPSNVELNLTQFFIQYYSSTVDIPDEILLENQIENKTHYSSWLSKIKNKSVKIIIPAIGEKSRLVAIAKRNSSLRLKELRLKKIKRKEYLSKPILQLKEDLGMDVPPRRIEAFDNSNIQGEHPVSGMVCFIDGKPKKTEYRKFHIKNVKGIDDFASIYEVIKRRYKRSINEKKPLPDLILIDGGKGQLSAAKSALDSLGLGYLFVIGIAKRLEEVYKPGIKDPQNIIKTSAGLHLLRYIRDEVHRFAITFHRNIRDKKMLESRFESISGMGKKRINRLWEIYPSLESIKQAKVREISSKTGFPNKICIEIKALCN